MIPVICDDRSTECVDTGWAMGLAWFYHEGKCYATAALDEHSRHGLTRSRAESLVVSGEARRKEVPHL